MILAVGDFVHQRSPEHPPFVVAVSQSSLWLESVARTVKPRGLASPPSLALSLVMVIDLNQLGLVLSHWLLMEFAVVAVEME